MWKWKTTTDQASPLTGTHICSPKRQNNIVWSIIVFWLFFICLQQMWKQHIKKTTTDQASPLTGTHICNPKRHNIDIYMKRQQQKTQTRHRHPDLQFQASQFCTFMWNGKIKQKRLRPHHSPAVCKPKHHIIVCLYKNRFRKTKNTCESTHSWEMQSKHHNFARSYTITSRE